MIYLNEIYHKYWKYYKYLNNNFQKFKYLRYIVCLQDSLYQLQDTSREPNRFDTMPEYASKPTPTISLYYKFTNILTTRILHYTNIIALFKQTCKIQFL